MVVYLDRLFLLNLGVDALLLSAARQLSRTVGSAWRTLGAALLGALYAAALFILPWAWLWHPLTRFLLALVMVRICNGGHGRTGAMLVLFLLLSLALAGGVLLLNAAGLGRMSSSAGVPVNLSDARILLLCAAGEYLLCSAACTLTRRSGSATVPILLRCEGRTVLLRALVDSGNLLRDPLSGKPVVVVSARAAQALFPPELCPDPSELERCESVCQRISEHWPGRVRLIPFHSVGASHALLLALRLDRLEVNGRVYCNRLAALSTAALPKGCQAIIGTEEGGVL